MAVTHALNHDTREPGLRAATKCAVLNAIWGSNYKPQDFCRDPTLGESYLRYYGDHCSNALARHTNSVNTAIARHQDVIHVVELLQEGNLDRETIMDELRAQFPNPTSNDYEPLLCDAIDLGVRLWLMIDVGEMIHSFIPGQRSLSWETGLLKTFIHGRFSPHVAIQERVKLERGFNARNLERIGGLRIIWSSNLADHLRLAVDDTRITIFHHASFLECHRTNDIFPPGFIEETIRTLALLIPDKNSRQWFRMQRSKWFLDEKAADCGHLSTEERQIENFVFWHDRLVILKQVFDETEPSTLAQWWCDRRRKVQWYTFWVAALVLHLTIIFGVIQCIEGGLQVWIAYHP